MRRPIQTEVESVSSQPEGRSSLLLGSQASPRGQAAKDMPDLSLQSNTGSFLGYSNGFAQASSPDKGEVGRCETDGQESETQMRLWRKQEELRNRRGDQQCQFY